MTGSIWKYSFRVDDEVVIEMPRGAIVLSVQMQGVLPCLWALVDADQKREPHYFRVFGTGHPFDLEGGFKFIGTFQDAPFMWHVFQVSR